MRKPSHFPIVNAFIVAFRQLVPGEGEAVVAEVEDFCRGYRDGKEEAERELFSASEGEPRVLSEVSGRTLAETMNDLQIRRRRGGRTTVRPS